MLSDTSHRDDRWRFFFAWRPSTAICRTIREAFANAGHDSGIRWVPDENLHITLYFAGNTIPEDVPQLLDRCDKVMEELCPFTLRSEGFQFRGRPGRASMIWLAFAKDRQFTDAHHALKEVSSEFVRPSALFRDPLPHITVARMGRTFRNEMMVLPQTGNDIPVQIEKVELWRSEKVSTGVYYSCIAGWSLS